VVDDAGWGGACVVRDDDQESGIPFLVLDGQFSRRELPLVIGASGDRRSG
jgi:hypothetical protein